MPGTTSLIWLVIFISNNDILTWYMQAILLAVALFILLLIVNAFLGGDPV